MEKTVRVSLTGSAPDGESESLREVWNGQFYQKDRAVYVLFDEYPEGTSVLVRSRLRIEDKRVSVSRGEAYRLIFEEGQRYESAYRTPYGPLHIAVRTTALRIRRSEHAMDIQAEYELELEGQSEGLRTIRIRITELSK